MAVEIGSWTCGKCGTHNGGDAKRCMRCRKPPAYNPMDIAQMSIVARVGLAVIGLVIVWVIVVAVNGSL